MVQMASPGASARESVLSSEGGDPEAGPCESLNQTDPLQWGGNEPFL